MNTTPNMLELVDLDDLTARLNNAGFGHQTALIVEATRSLLTGKRHGDFERWHDAIKSLPDLTPEEISLDADAITVGHSYQLNNKAHPQLLSSLQTLKPWRKGPFSIFGIDIDTEWRSDWKWQRLQGHISPLVQRKVLDVGCGNGYHVWRAIGSGADFVLGIDPGILFNLQFSALQRYIQTQQGCLLPLTLEQFPANLGCFDTVFSMGVIYHRRDPLEHLGALAGQLKSGGELILESLVMPPGSPTLKPENRYARMRNIGQIPTSETLAEWISQTSFDDVRIVSETETTLDEQRTTSWMPFESLAESLAPVDVATASECRDGPQTGQNIETSKVTVEGYPAPRRAIIIAKRL